jgi:ribosomal subunit interface protein
MRFDSSLEFTFKFRHLDSSESLMAHVQEQFEKLGKFHFEGAKIDVVFSAQKKTKEIDVKIAHGRTKFIAKCQSEDWYACVDQIVDKLSHQMDKAKSRQKSIRRKAG